MLSRFKPVESKFTVTFFCLLHSLWREYQFARLLEPPSSWSRSKEHVAQLASLITLATPTPLSQRNISAKALLKTRTRKAVKPSKHLSDLPPRDLPPLKLYDRGDTEVEDSAPETSTGFDEGDEGGEFDGALPWSRILLPYGHGPSAKCSVCDHMEHRVFRNDRGITTLTTKTAHQKHQRVTAQIDQLDWDWLCGRACFPLQYPASHTQLRLRSVGNTQGHESSGRDVRKYGAQPRMSIQQKLPKTRRLEHVIPAKVVVSMSAGLQILAECLSNEHRCRSRGIHSLLDRSHNWDSSHTRGLDDLSTLIESYSVLDMVLASRQRATGRQYPVVGRIQSIGNARWIPVSSLDSHSVSVSDSSPASQLFPSRLFSCRSLRVEVQSFSNSRRSREVIHKMAGLCLRSKPDGRWIWASTPWCRRWGWSGRWRRRSFGWKGSIQDLTAPNRWWMSKQLQSWQSTSSVCQYLAQAST